ncbi:MAG: glycosyltransferase [Deltaproteobacteria bacterium]|nr:glycosyltransferase [Deltaproteobacteria bacterium]
MTATSPLRLQLLMSDTGGGHRAAAQAIAAEVGLLDPSADVRVVDIIAEMAPFWRAVVGLYGPIVRTVPWLWGGMFAAFATGGRAPLWHAVNTVALATVRHRTLRYLDRTLPDAVLSTHPLISQACHAARLAWERERGRRIPFGIVITDPVTFHPSWIEPGADITFVATPEARDRAVACGAPADTVRLSGQPIHPRFLRDPPSRHQARAALSIPADAHAVLLTGGGEGVGALPALARAFLDLPGAPAVLAVAGRNPSGEAALRALGDAGGRLKVWGFCEQMPTLMAASDVVATKAGPGTVFEAWALGVPVVLVDALPGQEAGNVELVRSSGAGRVALGSAEAAALAVQGLLSDAAARRAAGDAARALTRPEAARDMARWLLDQARASRGE